MALFQNQVSFRKLRASCIALVLMASALLGAPAAMASNLNRDGAQTSPASLQQIFLDPTACLPANWLPATKNTFIVAQGITQTQVVVTVAAAAELDVNTAQYTLYTPGGSNSDWKTTSASPVNSNTVVITVANLPVYAPFGGGLESIQVKISPKIKGAGDPDACSPVHSIFAASKKLYLPAIFISGSGGSQDITTLSEPNNTACESYPLSPSVLYTARLNDMNDYYKITIPANVSSIAITVVGFNTTGQVQLRKPNGGCVTNDLYNTSALQSDAVQTRTLTVNGLTAGDAYIRVVSTLGIAPNTDYKISYTFSAAVSGPYEPNNSACQAYPIASGTTYQAYPEDSSDWYSFTLSGDTNVTLNLTNFNVTTGQYILYKATSCSLVPGTLSPITVQDKGITSFSVGTQSAGTYYLRVAVAAGANSSGLYNLRVDGSNTTWKPQGEACGVNGCGRPASSGENILVSWTGMPGLTSLKLKITTVQTGNCPAGNLANITPSGYANGVFANLNPVASGQAIFSNFSAGWYIFEFEGIATGQTTYIDRRGVKAACEFALANAPSFEATSTETQSVTLDLIPPTPIPEVTPVP